jgi:hypothetical protein
MREPLRKKIETAAKHRGVSMNSEVIARLERSFGREAWSADAISEMVEAVRKENADQFRALERRVEEMLEIKRRDK